MKRTRICSAGKPGLARIALGALLGACFLLHSCDAIDDDRIPYSAVNIEFSNIGQWNTYGVAATPDYRRFIKSELVPSNFPYTALTYTGFGGVLLVATVSGAPAAFDLACPVECKSNIRIEVDTDNLEGYCPSCGSRFDIYANGGYPVSGDAVEKKYGLKQYRVVGPDANGGYVVTR